MCQNPLAFHSRTDAHFGGIAPESDYRRAKMIAPNVTIPTHLTVGETIAQCMLMFQGRWGVLLVELCVGLSLAPSILSTMKPAANLLRVSLEKQRASA